MKIAHFIGTLKKEDGVTRVIIELIRQAQKRGIESIIVSGWAEDISISPVPVIVTQSIVFPLYKDYRLPLPGMKRFEKKLNEFKPDVIHIHSPDTGSWAACVYAKKYQIPIIATHHSDFIRYLAYYHLAFLKPVVWFLLKKLYTKMDAVTTPSLGTSTDLIDHGIKKVETLAWGVDFARFDPSFRSDEWRKKILGQKPAATTILLCVCRLTWEKDLRTLAQTYQLLKKYRDDFVLVISGDGPIRKELETMMPHALFLGHIEQIELSRVYASSDIFLFPSTNETFGNVTIEAMASGIVPVVANAGGSKWLVKDGETGFLATPKSAEDFYQKTAKLINTVELRHRMRAADLEFAKNFTWEHVFDNMLVIYKRLMQPHTHHDAI